MLLTTCPAAFARQTQLSSLQCQCTPAANFAPIGICIHVYLAVCVWHAGVCQPLLQSRWKAAAGPGQQPRLEPVAVGMGEEQGCMQCAQHQPAGQPSGAGEQAAAVSSPLYRWHLLVCRLTCAAHSSTACPSLQLSLGPDLRAAMDLSGQHTLSSLEVQLTRLSHTPDRTVAAASLCCRPASAPVTAVW